MPASLLDHFGVVLKNTGVVLRNTVYAYACMYACMPACLLDHFGVVLKNTGVVLRNTVYAYACMCACMCVCYTLDILRVKRARLDMPPHVECTVTGWSG